MSKSVFFSKCAIVLMLGASCAQAKLEQEYLDVIQSFNPANPTSKMTEQPETSWFGKARNGFGDGLRSVGDWFRTEDNLKTSLGQVSDAVKSGACAYASEQTGGLISMSFFKKALNPLGNALRSVGAQVRTVSETQTKIRVLMDKANIHSWSSTFDVNNKVSTLTKVIAKTGDDNTFFDLLTSIAKRGHNVNQAELQEKYALEAAKAIMVTDNNLTETDAKSKIRIRLESFFEKAGLELGKVAGFVSNLFDKAKKILAAERNRA